MVKRQLLWIDGQVQGVLVGRVVLYWFGLVLYLGISMFCFQWWQNPDWTAWEHSQALFEQVWPCLPTMLVLLPMVIFDIVRLSNRFVGPVYRLRMHLAQLRKNPHTYPLNFRDDDYWQQLAEPINELQRKLLVLEEKVQSLTWQLKTPGLRSQEAAVELTITDQDLGSADATAGNQAGKKITDANPSMETPLFDRPQTSDVLKGGALGVTGPASFDSTGTESVATPAMR